MERKSSFAANCSAAMAAAGTSIMPPTLISSLKLTRRRLSCCLTSAISSRQSSISCTLVSIGNMMLTGAFADTRKMAASCGINNDVSLSASRIPLSPIAGLCASGPDCATSTSLSAPRSAVRIVSGEPLSARATFE